MHIFNNKTLTHLNTDYKQTWNFASSEDMIKDIETRTHPPIKN